RRGWRDSGAGWSSTAKCSSHASARPGRSLSVRPYSARISARSARWSCAGSGASPVSTATSDSPRCREPNWPPLPDSPVSFLRLIGRVTGSLLGLGFIGGSGRRVRGVIAHGVVRLAQGSGITPARAGNTHTEESEHDHGNRITPARAGNTSGSGGDWRAPGAHPRSRGEYPCWPAPMVARHSVLMRLHPPQWVAGPPYGAGQTSLW